MSFHATICSFFKSHPVYGWTRWKFPRNLTFDEVEQQTRCWNFVFCEAKSRRVLCGDRKNSMCKQSVSGTIGLQTQLMKKACSMARSVMESRPSVNPNFYNILNESRYCMVCIFLVCVEWHSSLIFSRLHCVERRQSDRWREQKCLGTANFG